MKFGAVGGPLWDRPYRKLRAKFTAGSGRNVNQRPSSRRSGGAAGMVRSAHSTNLTGNPAWMLATDPTGRQ